jgi:hypothetical protein
MDLPAIPSEVPSMLGPVPVVLVVDLKDNDGEPLLGKWEPEKRRILLCANLHPMTALVTLYHERCHVWMWDAGVGLSMKDEERVADALSVAIVHDLLNRASSVSRAEVERWSG